MIVLTIANCPPKLRGDLSKWLLEINTGVYVGRVSARVREALWQRVCENIRDGQATMVFTANNEQHMDFYVHNTAWEPVDLDGIKLMKHPHRHNAAESGLKAGFSNAAKQRMGAKKRRRSGSRSDADSVEESFVIIDIETTGLAAEKDEILELGAIRIQDGKCVDQYQQLILVQNEIPETITALTGIENASVKANGIPIQDALAAFYDFIGSSMVLGYCIDFDKKFLETESQRNGMDFPEMDTYDVMQAAKSKIKGLRSYKLETIANVLEISAKQEHRALADCQLLYQVYCKLNENEAG